MSKEIWKSVNGYEGLYEISNCGRIKSLTFRKCVHGIDTISSADRILKPTDNGNGYLIIGLYKDKKRKNHYIHRLVAEHFNDNSFALPVVNHLDHNKRNNTPDNLEWCTAQHNTQYSSFKRKGPRANCRKTNTGEKYISKVKQDKPSKYRLTIAPKGICKYFKTLEEAVAYRNEVLKDGKEYFTG